MTAIFGLFLVVIQENIGIGNTEQESPFSSYVSSRLSKFAWSDIVNLHPSEVGRGQVIPEKQVFVPEFIP